MADAARITIEYADGTVGRFTRYPDGNWQQRIDGVPVTVTGYDGPNVLRVLANAIGTREIAPQEPQIESGYRTPAEQAAIPDASATDHNP